MSRRDWRKESRGRSSRDRGSTGQKTGSAPPPPLPRGTAQIRRSRSDVRALVALAKKAWKIRSRTNRAGKGEAIRDLAADSGRSVSFVTAMGRAQELFGEDLGEVIEAWGTSKLFEVVRLPEDDAREVFELASIRLRPGRRKRKDLSAIGWNELKEIVSRHVSREDHRPRGPRPSASRELTRTVEDLRKVWARVSRRIEEDREDGVVDEGELEAVGEAVAELRVIWSEMRDVVGRVGR